MCQECEICWDFIESSKSGASSLYLHNISKLKIKNKGSLRSPQNQLTLAKCFPFKNIPKCKKSSSFSKIVNNNAKLFIYTTTIEAHLFAEKWIYIALSQPLDICYTLKEISNTNFLKNFQRQKLCCVRYCMKIENSD